MTQETQKILESHSELVSFEAPAGDVGMQRKKDSIQTFTYAQ